MYNTRVRARDLYMKREEIIKIVSSNDSTVLSFPERGEWGDNKYRGNCSGYIHAFLIWKYKVEKMAELFSGSGTGYDVCKDMGIDYVGADLNPNPVRPGILNVNAVTDDVPEAFLDADFLFMHPPYGAEIQIPYAGSEWGAEKRWEKRNGKNFCNIIDHTIEMIPVLGYDPKQYDLGRMPWPEFMKTLNEIVMKYYSAMLNGGRMGILMGDVRRGGFYSMFTDIVKPGQLEQVIIKMQHNTVSERNNIQYAHKNYVPLVHEYIMILKKIAPYIIDFQLPQRYKMDIRDSKSATWRDVVLAVMESLQTASLEQIYAEIEGHKKCKTNPNWKAKVRQVLQQSNMFTSACRGVWAMAA